MLVDRFVAVRFVRPFYQGLNHAAVYLKDLEMQRPFFNFLLLGTAIGKGELRLGTLIDMRGTKSL